jgi:hypothetical protein
MINYTPLLNLVAETFSSLRKSAAESTYPASIYNQIIHTTAAIRHYPVASIIVVTVSIVAMSICCLKKSQNKQEGKISNNSSILSNDADKDEENTDGNFLFGRDNEDNILDGEDNIIGDEDAEYLNEHLWNKYNLDNTAEKPILII